MTDYITPLIQDSYAQMLGDAHPVCVDSPSPCPVVLIFIAFNITRYLDLLSTPLGLTLC